MKTTEAIDQQILELQKEKHRLINNEIEEVVSLLNAVLEKQSVFYKHFKSAAGWDIRTLQSMVESLKHYYKGTEENKQPAKTVPSDSNAFDDGC
jgi:predicted RecB family endonuclease